MKQENEDYLLKQIGRLEAQRIRIVEKIIENETKDVIKYEKMLLDMDVRINNLLMKIKDSVSSPEKNDKTIQEDKIKDLILFLMIKYNKDFCLTEDELTSEIINLEQITINEVSKLQLELNKLGLNCCKKFNGGEFVYDLMEFAFLRRYILPNDNFVTNVNALFILESYYKEQLGELKKKFKDKYGAKENWNEQVFEELDKETIPLKEKHAEKLSKTVVKALEKLSNEESIEKYLKYINVFFGDEKLQNRKIIEEWQTV